MRQEDYYTPASSNQPISDIELLRNYYMALKAKERADKQAGEFEQEIRARMSVRKAIAIPDEIFICVISKKMNYDRGKFTELKEIFSHDDLATCFQDAHFETIEVPGKWDLRKLTPMAKRYGQRALEILVAAELEPTVSLKFERKEDKE